MIVDDSNQVERRCQVELDQIAVEEILSLDFWP